MWREFKEFVNRGNVMDLAIGVIMGAAFGKIVSSAVSDVITPGLGMVLGKIDIKDKQFQIGSVIFKYGNFAQNVIDFLLVAMAVFLIVKVYNRFRKTAPPPPPPPPSQTESLLAEIRDLLKTR